MALRRPRRRLRRGDWQPAVGHDSRGPGRGRHPIARAHARDAGRSFHARRRRLHRTVGRPCQPLSAVRRTGDRAHPSGRPNGTGAAVGFCDRPGQRGAAAGCSSRDAASTRSSAWTIAAASSRSIAASGFSWSPPRRARQRTASPAGWIWTIRRRSNRWTRASPSGRLAVHVSPALLERISGPGPRGPEPALRPRPRHRRARGVALPAALQSDGRGACASAASSTRATTATFAAARSRIRADLKRAALLPVVDGKHVEPFRVALDSVRRGISPTDARRLLRSDRHERPRLGIPRRRQRHESTDAHRGGAAARTACRRTPSSACARRCRSQRSISSAVSSIASSSTTSCACASRCT